MYMYFTLSYWILCGIQFVTPCSYNIVTEDGTLINTTTEKENITEVMIIGDNSTSLNKTFIESDLLLYQESGYFQLQYYEETGSWFVQTKSCLSVGYSEMFNLTLNESFGIDCQQESFLVHVIPTRPIMVTKDFSVFTCPSYSVISFVMIRIENIGPCTTYNCSVNCINSEKRFWTNEAGMVFQSYANDINFRFDYHLNVTCMEDGVVLYHEEYATNIEYEITFYRKAQCPAPVSTSITAVENTTYAFHSSSVSAAASKSAIHTTDVPQSQATVHRQSFSVSESTILTTSSEAAFTGTKSYTGTKTCANNASRTPSVAQNVVTQKSTVFFKDPTKAALVTVGGSTMIIGTGAAAVYGLSRTRCIQTPSSTRSHDDNDEAEDA